MNKLLVLTIVLLALSAGDEGVGVDPFGIKADRDVGCGIDPNGCNRSDYTGAVDPNGRPAI